MGQERFLWARNGFYGPGKVSIMESTHWYKNQCLDWKVVLLFVFVAFFLSFLFIHLVYLDC